MSVNRLISGGFGEASSYQFDVLSSSGGCGRISLHIQHLCRRNDPDPIQFDQDPSMSRYFCCYDLHGVHLHDMNFERRD